MIGQWLARQDDVVLARLASVKGKNWNRWVGYHDDAYGPSNPQGCLICHAFDCKTFDDYFAGRCDDMGNPLSLISVHETERVYMRAVARFGNKRVGVAISKRAESILVQRYIDEIIADIPLCVRETPDAGIGNRRSSLVPEEHYIQPPCHVT